MASQDDEFTRLFNDFYPSLCRFLECLLGGGAALAQDIAQESFLQLHRTAWNTIPTAEARFWLYRVARNFALNEFRKNNTRHRLFERVVDVMSQRSSNPEEEYEKHEKEQLLLNMLLDLPEHQRSALLLREHEQLSYREIAVVLEVSESKVKIDIHRARIALRQHWIVQSKSHGAGNS
ncbi:MAG: RNA polymerase sigma factor [Pyrinomonadaceae bacterium]